MLERSTRFELENFAHGVRIQGVPERSILHYYKRLLLWSFNSILILESICEVENNYYPQTFLSSEFSECKFVKTHNNNNKSSSFEELVQIIDWSDDESNN